MLSAGVRPETKNYVIKNSIILRPLTNPVDAHWTEWAGTKRQREKPVFGYASLLTICYRWAHPWSSHRGSRHQPQSTDLPAGNWWLLTTSKLHFLCLITPATSILFPKHLFYLPTVTHLPMFRVLSQSAATNDRQLVLYKIYYICRTCCSKKRQECEDTLTFIW